MFIYGEHLEAKFLVHFGVSNCLKNHNGISWLDMAGRWEIPESFGMANVDNTGDIWRYD